MVRKILFVDDDPILRIAMGKRLATLSDIFTVIMASDGFEAVKKLEEISFSLVVVDLIMPRMDGMSLLNHIREKYPDIPVIIISGMVGTEMENLIETIGVIAYLRKPLQVDDLSSIIMGSLRKEAGGGIMNDISPTVFLQLMEMDCKTCTIRIVDKVSQKGGVLYFIEGELLDARIGGLKGIEAAYMVFSWDVVTIFVDNECGSRENKINSQLQPIIMKAVGQKDESEEVLSPPGESDELGELTLDGVFGELTDRDDFDQRKSVSIFANIRKLLQEELGEDCGLEEIYHDKSMGNVVNALTKIGEISGFGTFKVGCIDNGKQADRIILPGSPSILLDVSPDCSKDKILQFFLRSSVTRRDLTGEQ